MLEYDKGCLALKTDKVPQNHSLAIIDNSRIGFSSVPFDAISLPFLQINPPPERIATGIPRRTSCVIVTYYNTVSYATR